MSTSATGIAASNLWPEFTVPFRLNMVNSTTASSAVTDAPVGGVNYVVLGAYYTATGSNPITCFWSLRIPAAFTISYDSQSTGQGNGVRFTWRGQIPMNAGENVAHTCTSSAPIFWCGVIWGILIPMSVIGG